MYVRGQRHGMETGYSEAGVLKWKAEWRRSVTREYTEFYPNGQKRSATLRNGITEGPATGWFESGNPGRPSGRTTLPWARIWNGT